VQAIKVVPARDIARNSRSIQGVLSTARDEHVMHTFLDKTFCRSEAHMGRSAGCDRNLICNPLLSLAVCPGFSLDEKVRGEVVSNVQLHHRVRLGCCRNHSKQRKDTIETPNGRDNHGSAQCQNCQSDGDTRPSSFCWRGFRIHIFRGGVVGLKAKLPQDFFRVHTTDELDLFANQLQQDVCALRTDCG
jgi:hypothetical protein